MKKIIGLLILIFSLLGCGASEGAIQTAIAETQAVAPTNMVIPSSTPTAIPSQTPTHTPTHTPTKTPTNTNTPSPTPEPSTLTAIAATATQKAANARATGTKHAAEYFATATAQEKARAATEMAKYIRPERKELVTYPENFNGQYIVVRGRVFNVNNNQEFQFWIDGSSDAAYVYMIEPYSDIYEDTWVTVYGIGAGENCGTNAFGGQVCQPLIFGDFYELK